MIVRSRDEDGFNSAEAGWLEGRLWDILDGAPAAQLVGKKGDDQTLPQHDRERLEQYIPAITAVLRAIGASPDTPDQRVTPPEEGAQAQRYRPRPDQRRAARAGRQAALDLVAA